MNLIKYLKQLRDEAKEKGKESPTGITVLSPEVKVNRHRRRETAKQSHDYSERAKRKPKDYRKRLKAKRKLGRR